MRRQRFAERTKRRADAVGGLTDRHIRQTHHNDSRQPRQHHRLHFNGLSAQALERHCPGADRHPEHQFRAPKPTM